MCRVRLAAQPRARPKGTRKAVAVAAYLSGHCWWPDDLGRAIDHAMGTPNGAGNDPRNVINERGEGLEDYRGSLQLDVGSPDHLGPFLGFLGNELAEAGGREGRPS